MPLTSNTLTNQVTHSGSGRTTRQFKSNEAESTTQGITNFTLVYFNGPMQTINGTQRIRRLSSSSNISYNYFLFLICLAPVRARGLSRECVLRIPSVVVKGD